MREFIGQHVLVTGAGVTGQSVAGALVEMGARVTVTDHNEERLAELEGRSFSLVAGLTSPPDDVGLVVTSPGWSPTTPLLVAAQRRGVEVIGDVELAWRLGRAGPHPPEWLAVTGTNGKTTTVGLLESILRADGIDAVACGNVGFTVLDAVRAGHRVLAVELSSFQLHWSNTLAPHASVVLNIAEDHIDWHGCLTEYAAAKGRVHQNSATALYNRSDAWSRHLAEEHGSRQARRVGYSSDPPGPGELGMRDEVMIDRAFPTGSGSGAQELGSITRISSAGGHHVENALAAAGLARAYGVGVHAIGNGLEDFRPGPHRAAEIADVDGVHYVNDSKATNPHAAAGSLLARTSVVWIAGGQLKGASVEELVTSVSGRLRGVVLLGADGEVFAEALARHAPEIPTVRVDPGEDGPMCRAVTIARTLAHPGDTVLLAPAAASLDMFGDYAARGDAFAAAVGTVVGDAQRQHA